MNKVIIFTSLLFAFSCERATLNVSPALNSVDPSPSTQTEVWRSECYDNGYGQYFRDYFQFNSKTVAALTVFFDSSLPDCENEANGEHHRSYVAPYQENLSQGIWHASLFPNIGESGNLVIFIYTLDNNNLYRMHINDYNNLNNFPDDLDELQIEDLQEDPIIYDKIEALPDFQYSPPS